MRQNLSLFDKWSLVHAASGMVARRFFTPVQWLALHTLHELAENTDSGKQMWRAAGWMRYDGDSLANITGDTLATMAGYLIGTKK